MAQADKSTQAAAYSFTSQTGGGHAEGLNSAFSVYHQEYWQGQPEYLQKLASGQQPRSMVLSCCDSRVDPALLFACAPGDIFVHRAIGALVPAFESPTSACLRAATYYAVAVLKVEDLVVLGHTGCGGIKALVQGCDHTPLQDWIDQGQSVLQEARCRCPEAKDDQLQHYCERLAPLQSMANLQTYPWVAERLARGKLTLHAWIYDLREGHLYAYDPERDVYEARDRSGQEAHLVLPVH